MALEAPIVMSMLETILPPPSEKKVNDFQSSMSSSFGNLRKEKELFDVTLVSEDEVQISAHKVVLAACSTFFKNTLKSGFPHTR